MTREFTPLVTGYLCDICKARYNSPAGFMELHISKRGKSYTPFSQGRASSDADNTVKLPLPAYIMCEKCYEERREA